MNKNAFLIGFIEKVGFTVAETSPYNAERWVAESLGRLGGLYGATTVGQEKFLSYLKNPQKKDIEEKLQKFQKNKNLENTLVRLKGTDTIDDIKRIWRNDKQGLIAKLISTPLTPIANLQMSLTRGTGYNPFSDTATIFQKIPEIAQHEVGHAADFNNKSKAARTAYGLGRALEGTLLGAVGIQGGPLTQWQETAANREAYKAVGDDKPAWQNFRRRIWPARGTYIGGLGGSVAALAAGMNPMIGGTMGIPVGAIGGRILAEMKNWLENRQNKNKVKKPK